MSLKQNKMEPKISLTVTAEGQTRKVSFESAKRDGKVYIKLYHEQEFVGEMELALDDFNNFCLDISNLQKTINQ